MATITRSGSFDSMHRVMNEKMKCFNVHGHTYLYELTFGYRNMQEIGYTIDFKEIKRVFMQWIDDALDHGAILNPADIDSIELCKKLNSKQWIMSLDSKYCNPTVENIIRELYMAINVLVMHQYGTDLWIQKVKLNETPNCYAEYTMGDFVHEMSTAKESYISFMKTNENNLLEYSRKKGKLEYDDRKNDIAGK